MKMLGALLRRGRYVIVFFAAAYLIFLTVFSLYELPTAAVHYAFVLCLSVGALLLALRLIRYGRSVRQIENSLPSEPGQPLPPLPAPGDRLESAYQSLALRQQEHLSALREGQKRQWRQAQDYYTLWAHQIKTPLAAMNLLLSSRQPDTQAIAAELVRVEQYADMVLQYLRLEGEGNDLVLARYDVDEIVRAAVRRFSRLFIQKKIRLELTPGGLRTLTDEKWLAFVVEQLLSNALKYTPAGGVIRIFTRGEWLVVEDTGIGIRPEDLPRVSERTFTGYNGRRQHKSTGLGLYLCQQVVDMLGHSMRIDSRVGQGTSVRLNLSVRPLSPL